MKNVKKVIALIVAVSLVLVTLSACSPVKETKEVSASKDTKTSAVLNFGAMPSIDVLPIVLASEKGFFTKEGVNVNIQYFKSAKDRDAAFQSGNIDGIIGDYVAVCLYQNAGFDVKITGSTDGNFNLVASAASGIKNISEIKGKSVAISEKTCIEYSLDKMLEKNSMIPQDVQKTIIPAIPTRLEMLRTNKVDLALMPEPFSTLAIKDGATLLGSANEDGIFTSVTAFTQNSIDAKADQIKAFYRAYNEAVDYMNSTPISEYEDTIIKIVGYPQDMKGKIELPKFRKNTLPTDAELQSAIDWTVKNGLLKKDLTPKDITSSIGVN
jgi:NitT/TauT family transport system substrate-binding protein